MERLDKIIASMGSFSRKEVKQLIREGRVYVSGLKAHSPDTKIDPEIDSIMIDGKEMLFQQYVYLMLNKPSGILSATTDKHANTVLDLIPDEYRRRQVFPVGRLDKDTEGLLLITDDGELAHKLLSPKKHIDKIYFVKVEGVLTEEHQTRFREGIILADGYRCMSADLTVLKKTEADTLSISEALVTIREGKFHQIKRMFGTLDKPVLYLKRIRMGSLVLDENLSPGSWRILTKEEIKSLKVLV